LAWVRQLGDIPTPELLGSRWPEFRLLVRPGEELGRGVRGIRPVVPSTPIQVRIEQRYCPSSSNVAINSRRASDPERSPSAAPGPFRVPLDQGRVLARPHNGLLRTNTQRRSPVVGSARIFSPGNALVPSRLRSLLTGPSGTSPGVWLRDDSHTRTFFLDSMMM